MHIVNKNQSISDLITNYSLMDQISDDYIILYDITLNNILWRNVKAKDNFQDILSLNNILKEKNLLNNESSTILINSVEFCLKFNNFCLDKQYYSLLVLRENSEKSTLVKKLTLLQEFMNEVSEISEIGGWLIDVNNKDLIWNENVYKIHGLKKSFKPTLEEAIDFYTEEYKPIISQTVAESIHSLKGFDINAQIKTSNGKLRWVNLKGKTIRNNDESLIVYGTIQDITIEIESIKEKKLLIKQLEHKNRMDAIGQIAGGVAHDFNNILGGILNAAQLLEMTEYNKNDKSKKYISLIKKSSENATDLTKKLLTFSRKDTIESKSIDIIKVINESKFLISKSLNKNVIINTTYNSKESVVMGNYSEIENLVINMCLNSSYAMPNGGIINISTDNIFITDDYCNKSKFDITPGKYVQLQISDTGIGISVEDIDRIFEPFFTTKDIGEGTGLGLSAAYGIIETHKGEITVKSKKNVYTTFTVLLPFCDANNKSIKNNIKSFIGTGTILIVDDDDINRFLCKEILEKMGYRIIEAKNGKEAIEKYRTYMSEIDLVILDMIMPVINGYQAFKKLKQINGSVKVIITSGYSEESDINKMKDLGLNGFLNKPYRRDQISKLLQQLL